MDLEFALIDTQIKSFQLRPYETPQPYPKYKKGFQLHQLRALHHGNPQLCSNHVHQIDTFVDY